MDIPRTPNVRDKMGENSRIQNIAKAQGLGLDLDWAQGSELGLDCAAGWALDYVLSHVVVLLGCEASGLELLEA